MRLQKAGHGWETNTFTFLSPFPGEENHRGRQDLYCCDGNFHPMKGNTSSKIDFFSPPFKRFLYSRLSVLPRHFIDGVCWNEIVLWVALAKSFALSLKSNAIRKQSCGQERNPAPGRPGFDPYLGKIPWRRSWQPSPVFLPGEFPRTEESCGLQFMGSQSQTWVSD